MYRNKTARQHNFAIVPRADIPRSKFNMRQTRKQAFNASELIPIMCEEVLPGDTWQHSESIFARLSTPIAPLVDDMDLETFYFFVPNRITWRGESQDNKWEAFITGRDTALNVPTIVPYDLITAGPVVLPGGVFDHFGILPEVNTPSPEYFRLNVLPIWAYFKIYNEWFRDQNLQPEWTWPQTWVFEWSSQLATTAEQWNQQCLRINKRHDYFTSSLPWAQKGTAVSIALGGFAPVVPLTTNSTFPTWYNAAGGAGTATLNASTTTTTSPVNVIDSGAAGASYALRWSDPGLQADLSTATAQTINNIRLAFQTQKLLERDARGGSRYVEQTLAHFGVQTPDYRLSRPEYLGGAKIPITVNPIAQTATYDAPPAANPSGLGNLGAEMHAQGSKRSFTYAATEHGYIIGLAAVRSTPTYQQGTRRHWTRTTRLDFYFPVFSHLGEQAVNTTEIFQPYSGAPSNLVWGYQERHAEYRYTPNEITGVLRSTSLQPMDWWHLSEEFAGEPALNAEFITDKTQEVLARALVADNDANWSAQIIMDILHDSQVARMMPAYAVPGLIDHF